MPTVKDIKAELDELKVEYSPDDNKGELEKKLKKAKEATPENEAPEPEGKTPGELAEPENTEGKGLEVPADAKISVKGGKEGRVYTKNGKLNRVYTLKEGPDPLKLAKQYAAKLNKKQGTEGAYAE